MPANLPVNDLSLYVHWPFCRKKCPYCDFNSHVSTTHNDSEFGAALCREMTSMAALLPAKRALKTIFFGGGTPSLMPPKIVEDIIDHAHKIFGFVPDIEITAEANPTSVEARAMTEFYRAGVNRVSMGVQALDDASLKFLGREHSVSEALSALDIVRQHFDNLSIDLIYALAGQTPKAWQNTLEQALALDVPHLSLYQLTIEPGTVFYTRQRGGECLHLDDDHAADLFEMTQTLTAKAGLPAYEISNHAKPHAMSQHNLNYWRSGDWIGIGPGAHGRFFVTHNETSRPQRMGIATRRSPAGWLKAVNETGHGIETRQIDRADELAAECLMMGLRLIEGVSLGKIETYCGPQDNWLDKAAVAQALEAGWLDLETAPPPGSDIQMKVTASGRLRLNHIVAMILR